MNVYWVDGGEVVKYGYDPPEFERWRACGIFCANTPAQAKVDALREFNNDVEWLDLRVRLLAKNLDLSRGVFDDECPEGLWDDPDWGVDPPEPWATVWSSLGRLAARK